MWREISKFFWSNGKDVYCHREKLAGVVHIKSFKPLIGSWSKDNNSVWWGPFRLRGIDASSFKAMNGLYGKDSSSVWGAYQLVKGADSTSFEVLDPGIQYDGTPPWMPDLHFGYARDCNHVYFHQSTTGKPTVLKGADPFTFVSFANRYGKDKSAVYLEKGKLPKADPNSWGLLGYGPYSRDKKRVFYLKKEVKGADPDSFKIFPEANNPGSCWWGRDIAGFYRCGIRECKTRLEKDLKQVSQEVQETAQRIESGKDEQTWQKFAVPLVNMQTWLDEQN